MSESAYCPVKQLEQYLGLRRNKNDRLFVYPNLLPISRSQFINSLNAALSFIGLSTSVYKGHSFRIGASTWALQQGKSDTQVRALGRWKSNAFLKYLRPEIQLF
jgi:integrase